MLSITSIKKNLITKEVDIAPLVIFRLLFSALMFASLLRFWLKGWIYELYISPTFHFKYYGFEWVQSLGEPGMYVLFALVMLASVCMFIGYKYRLSALAFFIGFTYIELIDKTTYLNHYYFISLVSFLMVFLPANRYFSLDAKLSPKLQTRKIPVWSINLLKLQLGIVYFFAGIAKLNYDWLIKAMPLKLWLPAHTSKPIIGFLFKNTALAYVFSWFGALYDLLIPFLLLSKKTRSLAYVAVIVFHVLTYWLFPIGMFPLIMIGCTLIFFSEDFHCNLLDKLERIVKWSSVTVSENLENTKGLSAFGIVSIAVFMAVQFVFPFRHLAYEGPLFWHEQGYRFGWRVMLMEKAGSAFFYASEPTSKKRLEIRNGDYLTANQEKMMATQPDMILEFANYIEADLKSKGWSNPEVYSEVYVTLNGSGSRPFIDTKVNLASIEDSWKNKTWILPFEN